jgi:hypothetical protein
MQFSYNYCHFIKQHLHYSDIPSCSNYYAASFPHQSNVCGIPYRQT